MAVEKIVFTEKPVEFYSQTHLIWEAMYKDCLSAQKTIEFEQYIVRDDDIGDRFLSLFARKARQGVKIRLLLDRVGSRDVYKSKFIDEIRKYGGTIIFYNPISWINLFAAHTWFPRNHSKALLIDSRIAHIGSACLADYMRNWRDLGARITGPLVNDIEKEFSNTWNRRRVYKGPSLERMFDYVTARPQIEPNPVYQELLNEIRQAKKSVFLATPYFLPPPRLRQALYDALKRGVDVRVMITEETDVPLAVRVSQSYFENFLRKNMRIFAYQGTVFHSKYAIIDNKWAMMGSINIDYLSLLRNREANIIIRYSEIIKELQAYFLNDLSLSNEIKAGFWNKNR